MRYLLFTIVSVERFKILGLKLVEYKAVDMINIEDDEGNVKTVPDRPLRMRAQRWSTLKQHKLEKLSKFINSEKQFNFHPF